jgi:separase
VRLRVAWPIAQQCLGLQQRGCAEAPPSSPTKHATNPANLHPPPTDRCPSLAVAAAIAQRAAAAPGGAPSPPVLDLSSAYFLLNPDGDLPATQESFQGWLQGELGLEVSAAGGAASPRSLGAAGIGCGRHRAPRHPLTAAAAAAVPAPRRQGAAGRRPEPRTLAERLQSRDVFLYFGHGSGEQYLGAPALRRLPRCAGSLLMGCSSGRLRGGSGGGGGGGGECSGGAGGVGGGGYEPSGAIWGYLLAGCPAAVANLWDVTDRWAGPVGSAPRPCKQRPPKAGRGHCGSPPLVW